MNVKVITTFSVEWGNPNLLVCLATGVNSTHELKAADPLPYGKANQYFWLQIMVNFLKQPHIDGLVQEKSNSSALAMELRHSCTNPSIFSIAQQCSQYDLANGDLGL